MSLSPATVKVSITAVTTVSRGPGFLGNRVKIDHCGLVDKCRQVPGWRHGFLRPPPQCVRRRDKRFERLNVFLKRIPAQNTRTELALPAPLTYTPPNP